jgi:microfibrillar-associated protein 1
MSDEDDESGDGDFDVPLVFVSKAERRPAAASSSDSDSASRKSESVRMAKAAVEAAAPAAPSDCDRFREPPAPDANDSAADAGAEYRLWLAREVRRLRDELRAEADFARDAAATARLKRATDAELEAVRAHARPRGRMRYMQKYYHRGAFSAGATGDRAEQLLSRDVTEAVGADRIDKTLLPEAMRVRGEDWGKKGRSKWTNLRAEDTTTPESRRTMGPAERRAAQNDKRSRDVAIVSFRRFYRFDAATISRFSLRILIDLFSYV